MLTLYEQSELKKLNIYKSDEETQNDRVYFAGDVSSRNVRPDENAKKMDDQDGYFIVTAGEHILYRFEIIKVLGKGSFAQVVSAIDHKTGKTVAIKINRNTEVDHKFAKQEAKLL